MLDGAPKIMYIVYCISMPLTDIYAVYINYMCSCMFPVVLGKYFLIVLTKTATMKTELFNKSCKSLLSTCRLHRRMNIFRAL